MKVEIREQINGKWISIDYEKVVGMTLLDYVIASKYPIVCGIFKDDGVKRPYAFVSNREEFVKIYEDKGWSIHSDELKLLMGTEVGPELIVKVFPGSTLVEICTEE